MIEIKVFDDVTNDFIQITETHCFDDSIPMIQKLIKELEVEIFDWEIQHRTRGMAEYYRKTNKGPNWDEALTNYPKNNGKRFLHGELRLELLCIRGKIANKMIQEQIEKWEKRI